MEFITILKQMPKPENPTKPFMRLICDGDLVAVHLSIEFMGKKKAVVDLYRIEDGLIAEHWDAVQDISNPNLNGNPVVEGPVNIEDANLTDKNKAIVNLYSQQVLIGKQYNKLSDFIAADLIQHNPEIINGRIELMDYYKNVRIAKVHRLIGEGNFVLTQSDGSINNLPYVIYDIYRLKNSEIVEHWSAEQIIPEKMVHNNGMI
jgi:predicted SnoaL-like aldol condensation-catalyzing enzyme